MSGTIEADDVARFAPSTFGCHETLHTAHVPAETVDERPCGHPAVRPVPEWKAQADRATAALHDLHQAIGARHGAAKGAEMPKGPRGEKRPADVIADAVHVVRSATGEATSSMKRRSPTMRMHTRRCTRRVGQLYRLTAAPPPNSSNAPGSKTLAVARVHAGRAAAAWGR